MAIKSNKPTYIPVAKSMTIPYSWNTSHSSTFFSFSWHSRNLQAVWPMSSFHLSFSHYAGAVFFFPHSKSCTKNSRNDAPGMKVEQLNLIPQLCISTLFTYRYWCFLKWWYPQIIHFNRVFHHKPSISGYPYFWKHPYMWRFFQKKKHQPQIAAMGEANGSLGMRAFCIYIYM